MKRTCLCCGLIVLFFAATTLCWAAERADPGPSDLLTLTGTVNNSQGKGINDAGLTVVVEGKGIHQVEKTLTDEEGSFQYRLALPQGQLSGAEIALEVSKPSYKSSGQIALKRIAFEYKDANGNSHYLAHEDIVLQRAVTAAFWIATLVLLGVYVLIAFEFFHRTLAALIGAALLLTVSYTLGTFYPDYFILSFEDAVRAIDMNVIFLLMAMMIIVGVMKKTGVFQWLALKSYEASKGNIYVLCAILMVVTAVISAFLDNVTTMLLVTPVTVEISRALKLNPLTLLLPEVFASNVGGTATLIGDPPNIMIGSYGGLTFMDFVKHLSPICFIVLAVCVLYYIFYFRKEYRQADTGNVREMAAALREEYKIKDAKLLKICLIILGITILLFIMHGALHMEPSIAALIGAGALLVLSGTDIVEMLEHEIEWPTLIFFIMLFIVVGGAESTGLIQVIADGVRDLSKGSLVIAVILILWVSAIASAFIDNIPFTATMLPIVAYLNQTIPGAEGGILWWSLALGACLGGNGTLIGASANVVTVGIAESLGYPVSFMKYMKMAWWPMIISVALCMVWLLVAMM
jgi:Na+/H+ antiporter NhaD/arsenite permease-like protein